MNAPISRRTLLKLLATAAGGAGLVGIQRWLTASADALPGMNPRAYLPAVMNSKPSTPTPTRTPTATPTPTRTPTATTTPSSLTGKVVHVHSNNATTWTGQSDYWNYVNQNVVNDIVDQGMMALTNKGTVADAWGTLLPDYQPGQGIAIKVSFNNWGGSSKIDGLTHPVNAIVRGLKQIGVAETDVWVYDATRGMPDCFVNGCQYSGVRFFATYREPPGWSSTDPSAHVVFYPPSGVSMPPATRVTDLLIAARYLINMPIMKKHGGNGLSLAFKNHFGSIDNPGGLHDYIMQWMTNYDALVDLYRNQNIGAKTVITVADGLFGASDQLAAPSLWTTFTNHAPNSLFFATDPVAVDCVMCDLLAAEFGVDSGADKYLRLANQAGLGVYERGDPWGSGYSQIHYSKIER